MYINGNFKMESDYEVRVIREDEFDVDLFIDINYRSVDLDIGNNDLNISRIQFQMVKAILLRFSKNGTRMTCHMLRDIDLYSAFSNFEIEYKDRVINIEKVEEKVVLSI
ncbi:hypothetical protein [Tepidibacter hydrothermalis]|uniref:Uncharacterized protein n=1 Tax=Tepidibacter hydrothermalis TaxID=3036126 RepID=A0ABY8EGF8_9FIRM|nr:hypothetical protein [Tepidibacter hydrothermalis]WFD09853.1 hypothetical protein P4S50_15855 [Tepidibacter hydrothermalis]